MGWSVPKQNRIRRKQCQKAPKNMMGSSRRIFGTSRRSWSLSADAGMAQNFPNFRAPGIRLSIQNCCISRGEMFHFFAGSRTVRYSMAKPSRGGVLNFIIGPPVSGREGTYLLFTAPWVLRHPPDPNPDPFSAKSSRSGEGRPPGSGRFQV